MSIESIEITLWKIKKHKLRHSLAWMTIVQSDFCRLLTSSFIPRKYIIIIIIVLFDRKPRENVLLMYYIERPSAYILLCYYVFIQQNLHKSLI